MAVTITDVEKGSLAEKAGLLPGDVLISINGHGITDILDYRFFETESRLKLKYTRAGKGLEAKIVKEEYAGIGLDFETYLMDRERSCKNKCIFCFIDQLPKGMRESLYFKDDDERLSFLFGNYITLTNIGSREIDRIIDMHISPVNISVHTMNPELRCMMMNNRFAGDALKHLYKLAAAGVLLNCQMVLCPGINDGENLSYSLEKFMELGDSLLSVACVPVGLTRYRDGLYPLVPYNSVTAAETIDIIEEYGGRFLKAKGSRIVYPSDEFYLIAGRPLPPYEFYEDFPQLENGVGMLVNLREEFEIALENAVAPKGKRHVSIVTGEAPYEFLKSMLDESLYKWDNLLISIFPVKNEFFGGTVNVTGLLAGTDIVRQLSGKELGDELLLPENMLKADEEIFLDDMTLSELATKLGIAVRKTANDGEALLNAILGIESSEHRRPWQQYERKRYSERGTEDEGNI